MIWDQLNTCFYAFSFSSKVLLCLEFSKGSIDLDDFTHAYLWPYITSELL